MDFTFKQKLRTKDVPGINGELESSKTGITLIAYSCCAAYFIKLTQS